MPYQHPLAYLLALEGIALQRAYAGDFDRDFTEARIAEIRRLLAEPALAGSGVFAQPVDTVTGYRSWSRTYDEPRNGLFDQEEAIVHAILDPLAPGIALDAACGTGRHAEYLVRQGHQVIGVDSSPDMLSRASQRVPSGDFRPGALERLPVPDAHVDIVVCGLALTHVVDLKPVFAEFARVLRPGGHLVTADVHRELVLLGSVPRVGSAEERPRLMPASRHRASDYLGAALPLGLQVRSCVEPVISPEVPGAGPTEVHIGPWDDWPWSLLDIAPEAAHAAWNGTPALIIWHFQLD